VLPTPPVIDLNLRPIVKNRDPSFSRPRSSWEGSFLPVRVRAEEHFIGVMGRSILNRMTIEAQATNLRCHRGLLRLIEMNRGRPAVLERACQKIVRRPPPGLNGSDLVMTEEGLQTSWSALEPCGDWGRAITSLCKGQETGVDIIRGG
jgi:hypothetical protein